MHTRCAGLDHVFHQLKGVQYAAKTRLRIRHDGQKPIDAVVAFGVMDLIGADQGIVDPADHRGYAVDWIKRLIGIHGKGAIGIGRDLPAAQIDRLEPGLGLLHRLIAGQRAQGANEILAMNEPPQLLCTPLGQGIFDWHRPAQAHYIRRAIAALNISPAGILRPLLFQFPRFVFGRHHYSPVLTLRRYSLPYASKVKKAGSLLVVTSLSSNAAASLNLSATNCSGPTSA